MRTADPRIVAGRAFIRSLNILLKFARLYGYEHARTIAQLQLAWHELRSAVPAGTDAGLLLGATGTQLLLDGVPLESSPAEKQFAQLLSAAGLASVQFFPSITEEELSRFARSFPTSKAKPTELARDLKSSLSGAAGIRINEICFVATDSRLKDVSLAAQIAAASFGNDQDQFKQWFSDPRKLLELIAAAEGSQGTDSPARGAEPSGTATSGNAEDTASGGLGTAVGGDFAILAPAAMKEHPYRSLGAIAGSNRRAGTKREEGEATDEEIYSILGALTSFGQVGAGGAGGMAAAGVFHERMSQLPGRAQDTLKRAVAGLAAQASDARPDEHVLVQLAEHLAIRYALERYERGDVKVNAVRQMLDRMNQEIGSLRKILAIHEDRMSAAGLAAESHGELLDRQFWAAVPERAKQAVLLSNEAWCIPPRNVQSYVGELIEKGNLAEAIGILQNYSACADSEEVDARKKTAVGLSEMASLYATADPGLLGEALRHVGLRLSTEKDKELQVLVSAAFVRLSQEATAHRYYPAMGQALELISALDTQRPGVARAVRQKMGIEECVPEFVDEAIRARHAAVGLSAVLKQLPQVAVEQLSARFNRCSLRDDAEVVAGLASELGEQGVQYLRSIVQGGPVAEAVDMVGLLSKLDLRAVEMFLPNRAKDFPLSSQDRIVRQISASGVVGRSRVLLDLLDRVDPLVMPLVIDEVGITADRLALPRLIAIARGDLPIGAGPYVRLKAAEALGYMNAPESVTALQQIVEEKKMFGWLQPQELRITAMQALEKLDPLWVRGFLPKSGLDKPDMLLAALDITPNCKFVRQRRHVRVRLHKPVMAMSTNLKENCRLEIKTASLSGGVASISRHLAPGTQVQLKLQLSMRSVQVIALMRDYRAQDMSFEILDMNLDERSKYRRLLTDSLSSRSNDPTASDGALGPVQTAASG